MLKRKRMDVPKCRLCGKNEVPHKKYACLSCICVADSCMNAVIKGTKFCQNHTCTYCKATEGIEYITITGSHHIASADTDSENIQYCIDFDICSRSTFIGIRRKCEFINHVDVCNKYNNTFPTAEGSGHSRYHKCGQLNLCTKENCKRTMMDNVLMRCSEHYNLCHYCKKNFIDDINNKNNKCASCVARGVVDCSGCNGRDDGKNNKKRLFHMSQFNNGEYCLHHFTRNRRCEPYIRLQVKDGFVINSDAEIANILKYYYVMYLFFKRKPPVEYLHLLTLPKDLFYLIIKTIISTPIIMTSEKYISTIPCCDISILKK